MRIEMVSLAPGRETPNHPRFPALVYRDVVPRPSAAALEAVFRDHGWPPSWRDGIFSYHHYHTRGHEALGCAGGRARVLLGGPEGQEVDVVAGDVMVLPAGTGHCLIEGSGDLLIVGAYPPGQSGDICRGPASADMLARIRALPVPERDPVGATDGVPACWGGDDDT